MRKILLAGAAMLATTGMAMALDSESVQISAVVTANCTLTDPADISFPNNSTTGATANRTFDFTCNFSGTNGGGLSVGFQSTNGGLNNPADATTRLYNLVYETNTAVASSAIKLAPASYSETSAAANAPQSRAFTVTLNETLPVAGSYTDTLNVTIAP